MANKLPLFSSAPRCKISVGGRDVAYAIGLSVSASVNLQEVRILGEFAVQSIEPVAYLPVSGSFQVVRLLSKETQAAQTEAARAIHADNSLIRSDFRDNNQDVAAIKNSVQNTGIGDANDFGQSELYAQLDPQKVLGTQSFDIEIKLKVPKGTFDGSGKFTPTTGADKDFLSPFLTIKDCRLIGASANIAPSQILSQSLEFQGLLMVNEARGGAREELDSAFTDGLA
jgi:hypothetical protein